MIQSYSIVVLLLLIVEIERSYIELAISSKIKYIHLITRVSVQYRELLYFFDQTSQLLFISLLVLCGYYSRAEFISLETCTRLQMISDNGHHASTRTVCVV